MAKDQVDLRDLASGLGLEVREFTDLFQLFVDTGLSDVRRLRRSLGEDDPAGAAEAAHSLKGAALSMGQSELFEAARDVEEHVLRKELGMAGPRVDEIADRLHDLASLLNRAKDVAS